MDTWPLVTLLAFFVLNHGNHVICLRILMLDVPSPTVLGESVELACSYDLEGDKLYSIKWYKNDVEFYRFHPEDWPPGQYLPINGVRLDLSKSTKNSVYLKHVDLNSAGLYRCEISAEAPIYKTAEAEKDMIVYVLPSEGPRISGSLAKVKSGDFVSVNCTSAKSKPASQLRWFVNEMPVDVTKFDNDYETISSNILHSDGQETSSLVLKFMVTERHLRKGNMKLKCTASMSRMYTMSNEALMSRKDDNEQSASGIGLSENLSQVHGKNNASNLEHCLRMFSVWLMVQMVHSHSFT